MRGQSSGVNTARRSPFAQSYGNGSEARPNLSGAIPISTDTLQVFAGERYRVSIQVETTNGDVAGDALSRCIKAGEPQPCIAFERSHATDALHGFDRAKRRAADNRGGLEG